MESSLMPRHPHPPTENVWWLEYISCHRGLSSIHVGVIESADCAKNAIIKDRCSFLDYLSCSPTFKQSATLLTPETLAANKRAVDFFVIAVLQ